MKATGIVRRVDDLGRVFIPKELRLTHDITEGDPLEIFTDDKGNLVLRKYTPGCTICGGIDSLQQYNGKLICLSCIQGIAREAGHA